MKPWSWSGAARVAPAARAVSVSASTSARLAQENATSVSDARAGSQISREVNVRKNASSSSITQPLSLSTIQAAFSSVNCGLNVKPRVPKNAIDAFRLRTGRLTKSSRFGVAMSPPCVGSLDSTVRDAETHRSAWRQLEREAEPGKQVFDIEERVPRRDPFAIQFEDDDCPGLVGGAVGPGMVLRKG